jgi:hypothetical protein
MNMMKKNILFIGLCAGALIQCPVLATKVVPNTPEADLALQGKLIQGSPTGRNIGRTPGIVNENFRKNVKALALQQLEKVMAENEQFKAQYPDLYKGCEEQAQNSPTMFTKEMRVTDDIPGSRLAMETNRLMREALDRMKNPAGNNAPQDVSRENNPGTPDADSTKTLKRADLPMAGRCYSQNFSNHEEPNIFVLDTMNNAVGIRENNLPAYLVQEAPYEVAYNSFLPEDPNSPENAIRVVLQQFVVTTSGMIFPDVITKESSATGTPGWLQKDEGLYYIGTVSPQDLGTPSTPGRMGSGKRLNVYSKAPGGMMIRFAEHCDAGNSGSGPQDAPT